MAIAPDDILKYCLDNLEGTVEVNSWGERGIFYNPDGVLKRGGLYLDDKKKRMATMIELPTLTARMCGE